MTLPAGLHALLLVLLSLPGPEAWAQAGRPAPREVKARRMELSPLSSEKVPEVRVAAGYLTALEFDAPLECESLAVEGRESRLALLECNTRTLVLRPEVELAAGERLLLTVGFADGLAPAKLVLALVAHPTEVDGQVQVVRQALSSEALQARLEAALARCEAGALAKVVLSGAVDKQGVTMELLDRPHHWNGLRKVPLQASKAYRSWKLFVAVIPLHLPAGGTPWVPGEARLLDAGGQVVRRMPVWMDMARFEPGQSGVLAVEVERLSEELGKTFSLEVREREGERGVLIQQVRL